MGLIHIPAGGRFPNGTAFAPSSEDKAVKPIRVSVWETRRATYQQALRIYLAGKAIVRETVACAVHVGELLSFREREARLRVVWDPLPSSRGHGGDAHCGIEGLDHLPGGSRKEHKKLLDDIAQRAVRIDEAAWQASGQGTPGPSLSVEARSAHPGISRRLVALISVFVVLAGVLAGIEIGRRQVNPLRVLPAASVGSQIERRITEELSAALDESESVPQPSLPIVPAANARVGFVYLGICDGGAWTKAYFGGLPACGSDGTLPANITARRGTKVRGTLPAGGKFGDEVGRLRFGEAVRLVRIHPMLGDLPLPGPKVVWGEISR
jgi:hypothetical protein